MGTLADRIGTSYAREAVRPRNGGDVFYRYRLHEADGSDAGEAHYAYLVKPGETIITGAGRKAARARRRPGRRGGLTLRWAP